MNAGYLTVGQWWIVAILLSALFPAAFYFCLRSKKGAIYSLTAPALGAFSVLGASRARGHLEVEALVIFSAAMLPLVLLPVAIRPDVRKYAEKARVGEEYEVPKWKINLYAVLGLTLAIGIMFLLL